MSGVTVLKKILSSREAQEPQCYMKTSATGDAAHQVCLCRGWGAKNIDVRELFGISLTIRGRASRLTELLCGHAFGTSVFHITVAAKFTHSGPSVCSRISTHAKVLGAFSLISKLKVTMKSIFGVCRAWGHRTLNRVGVLAHLFGEPKRC
jgi:hypothetical protein